MMPDAATIEEGGSVKAGVSARWRLLVAVAVFTLAILVLFAIWWSQRGSLWSGSTIDAVVRGTISFATVALLGGVVVALIFPGFFSRQMLRDVVVPIGGAVLLVITLYVGYATFRNQTRLTAEADLNAEAMQLYELELANPQIRCLYYNYRSEDSNRCLERIVADPQIWSLTIFYVEEAWFVLTKAGRDRDEWGSTYAASVQFWVDDVELDPTGMFSFYLVMSSDTLREARAVLAQTGVEMGTEQLCVNYGRVWRELARRRSAPPVVGWCAYGSPTR